MIHVTQESIQMGWSSLTIIEQAVVKWQYAIHPEHSFMHYLWQAIKMADDSNMERLGRGFAVEVEGITKYREEMGWWEKVQEKIAVKGGDKE